MKLRLDKKFLDLKGAPLKEGEKELTLSEVCVTALLASGSDKIDGKEKYERYTLSQKLYDKTEVDLSTEETAKLKKLIGEIYSPIIVGQAWDLLEGK